MILPDDVDKDKIDAKVNDGVLTIELPKRTPEDKEKQPRLSKLNNMLSNSEKRDCRRGSSSFVFIKVRFYSL